MPTSPVFYDPSGQRNKVVRRSFVALGLVLSVVSTLFVLSLLALPALPMEKARHRSYIPKLARYDQRQAEAILQKTKRELAQERAKKPATPPQRKTSDKIALAFYAPWQQAGLKSLEAHANAITHLAPAWLAITPNGDGLDTRDYDLNVNPANIQVARIARQHHVAITPVLANSDNSQFDVKRLVALLDSPAKQDQLIAATGAWLEKEGYDGINLDFEQMPDAKIPAYIDFLKKLKTRLGAKTLSVDIEASLPPKQVAAIAEIVDWVVLMLYDEHADTDPPGPIASLTWSTKTLESILNEVPEDKVVVGLGTYAYDWEKGEPQAETLTFEDAMATAAGYRDNESAQDVISVDPDSVNPTFTYTGDGNTEHTVWMLDAVTAYNQWHIAQDMNVRGLGLWVLGTEDPGVWSFVDKSSLNVPPKPDGLQKVVFPDLVDYVGRGEFLSIKAEPQTGQRKLDTDPDSGNVLDWIYTKYAFPYVLQKSGWDGKKKLVLTFDDGPDPEYTPQILDKLKALNVKATFFVIGQNAEQYPDLVRRIYEEGHEIGSHTYTHPDLSTVSDRRAKLELNATQRVIESIVGRSTVLFRPPYNADSQPAKAADVHPLKLAGQMGYINVMENIDPQDWETQVPTYDPVTGERGTRKKTAKDIYDFVMSDIAHREQIKDEGNMVLLHDAGGDRSATVAVLDELVTGLRKKGYEFVSAGDLLKKTRAQLMPPIPENEKALIGFDLVIFRISYWVEKILTIAFLSAIALGLGRSVLITLLAFLSRRRARTVFNPEYRPTVTALIAAYNEETVIARTIESVLASEYPITEILVVDDGSTDKTAEVVEALLEANPRVRLMVKENGGKASALNQGIEVAQGEILFCIDADTQLDPKAIGLLVRHFDQEDVAAVAGNVKVGNAENLLTRWQSLEYTSSQNVDRRAYGLLNCITVVPGAIGAWRRSAVQKVGNYLSDTLAEDMDLTWRLRREGFRLVNEPKAIAYTEAPSSWRGFAKQRFRWAYGTLQCLMKHRRAIGTDGWFGWFALPSLWIFQIVFQILAPLIDLKVLFTLGSLLLAVFGDLFGSLELRSAVAVREQLVTVAVLYGLFFLVELLAAWFAYRWDNAKKADLWYLFMQRFVYRQMMYGVVLKSLWRALTGGRQGWGKIQRTGTVRAR